jgi:Ankyrin repeat
MKVMDSLPQILGKNDQATNEPNSYVLEPVEIRLIADGKLANITDFAASSRLNATDPKGDAPLHTAARIGNPALCDLFIRSGADPGSLNHARQTPADVAFAEGNCSRRTHNQKLASSCVSSLGPYHVLIDTLADRCKPTLNFTRLPACIASS